MERPGSAQGDPKQNRIQEDNAGGEPSARTLWLVGALRGKSTASFLFLGLVFLNYSPVVPI
jgi:hypothetical protein